MKLLFTTIIGHFITDKNAVIIDHIKFKKKEDYLGKEKLEKALLKKDKSLKKATLSDYKKFLPQIKNEKYFDSFRKNNVSFTIHQIKNSVGSDNIINHAINNVDEIDKINNILVKRLREWSGLYIPEVMHKITDHQVFVEMILEKKKDELLKLCKVKISESMGAHFEKKDIDQFIFLAKEVQNLYKLREQHVAYLERVMDKYCKNMKEVCGVTIAAKLIEMAGSLKRLALLPSSTIQLLGAEKALFRHLTRRAKSPKHGIIVHHPLVTSVEKKMKGKASRALADKISIAARLDYFKGEFKGKEMRKQLEKRFL